MHTKLQLLYTCRLSNMDNSRVRFLWARLTSSTIFNSDCQQLEGLGEGGLTEGSDKAMGWSRTVLNIRLRAERAVLPRVCDLKLLF